MAVRYGKCTNFGLCGKADTREAQAVADAGEFVCAECGRPLTAVFGADAKEPSRVSLPFVASVLLIILLLGGGVYYWTTKRSSEAGNDKKGVSGSSSGLSGSQTILRLSGSNTIGAQLVPALAEAWLSSRGGTGIHRESPGAEETRVVGTLNGSPVAVEITAHGSATAFTGLSAETCDVGMSSRKIKPTEVTELRTKGAGDMTSNANERVLGLDGVAVIVNEANTLDTMSIPDVAAAFSGAGGGRSWNVYARDEKSGTWETFRDRVLGPHALVSNAKRFEDSKQLVAAVAADREGIGFVGLPYASGAKVLAISDKGALALVPNANTVRTESYALSRRLYLYLPDTAKPEAREFVRFALSDTGQEIVEKNGFVGQKVVTVSETKAPAKAPAGYLQLMPSADRLSVDFRFRTGSSDLDTKAVDDIKRVASTMNEQFRGRNVMLVGFADSTGTPSKNLALSKDRAQSVAQQMARQGVAAASVTGFGQELPVADNGTPEGRERNRRVEIWLRK